MASRSPLAALSLLLAAASVFLVFFAWITDVAVCDEVPAESCTRAELADTQLWIALGGLLPVALMLLAAFRGSRAQLIAAMALTVVVYAVWAVFNDAAVHGWGSEMLLVP